MKFFSYFKRVKQPISKVEDATPIIKETKLYLIICIIAGILCSACSGIPVIGWLLGILMIVFVAGVIYFGIMLYAMKRVTKRLSNLTCSKCGTQLGDNLNTSWEEIKRHWVDSNNGHTASSKLYVTVKFTCKCPKCGEVKQFTEELCSGKITVANNLSVKDNLVSVQDIVNDYLNGLIHA